VLRTTIIISDGAKEAFTQATFESKTHRQLKIDRPLTGTARLPSFGCVVMSVRG